MVSVKEMEIPQSPDVTNLGVFPLGGDVVAAVFEKLEVDGKTIKDLFKGYLNVSENLTRENREAATYLYNSGDEIADEGIKDRFYLGHLLFYATLIQKFGEASIPKLTESFVDDYEFEKADRAGTGDLDLGVPVDEDGQLTDLFGNLALFRLAERDAVRELREGVKKSMPDFPDADSDYLMAGFAQAYFLFNIGLSNPDNYEQFTARA